MVIYGYAIWIPDWKTLLQSLIATFNSSTPPTPGLAEGLQLNSHSFPEHPSFHCIYLAFSEICNPVHVCWIFRPLAWYPTNLHVIGIPLNRPGWMDGWWEAESPSYPKTWFTVRFTECVNKIGVAQCGRAGIRSVLQRNWRQQLPRLHYSARSLSCVTNISLWFEDIFVSKLASVLFETKGLVWQFTLVACLHSLSWLFHKEVLNIHLRCLCCSETLRISVSMWSILMKTPASILHCSTAQCGSSLTHPFI